MSASTLRAGRRIQCALVASLLLPLACAAESTLGHNRATSRLAFRVVVPPVLRVLQVRPLADGYEYRIWTNTRSAVINGREVRFSQPGETTLKLPAAPNAGLVVHGGL